MPSLNIDPPQPPNTWQQVPNAIRRKIDLSAVVRDALLATNHPSPYRPLIALSSLESYVGAAKRQQNRMKRAMSAPWRPKQGRRSSLFDDTHFYLIAWARIAKLGTFISRETGFRRVGLVLRRYRTDLDVRIAGRDHLEHFEERLPGGPQQKTLLVPNDVFNMADSSMTYGGKTIDIGPKSLVLLLTLVAELRAALMFDAVETLVTEDITSLRRLLDRAASEVHVARVSKKVLKMLSKTTTRHQKTAPRAG